MAETLPHPTPLPTPADEDDDLVQQAIEQAIAFAFEVQLDSGLPEAWKIKAKNLEDLLDAALDHYDAHARMGIVAFILLGVAGVLAGVVLGLILS